MIEHRLEQESQIQLAPWATWGLKR